MKPRQFIFGVIIMAGMIAAWFGWRYWWEHRFDDQILASARRYQVDPALVKAIIWRETDFDPDAHGRAGELGLMQVRATAAQEWAASEHLAVFLHADCLDPATNTLAGTWYLKHVLRRYAQTDNPVPYALADYNAGRSNILKWKHGAAETNSAEFIKQIAFPSTRRYVQLIMKRAEHYEGTFRTNAVAAAR
jgi:soluble lytic murein transglycosylase